MQVRLEEDNPKPLGIPYGVRPERRFWNLKKDPTLVENVPELIDCPELREFAVAINRPASCFGTLGCEAWSKGVEYDNGLTNECGLYVDIIYDRLELAAERSNYEVFASDLIQHGKSLKDADPRSGLTLIRIQLMPVVFHDLNVCVSGMSAWVYGCGRSEDEAARCRQRGLREFLVIADRTSAEMQHHHRGKGTPLFDII